jgi:hypothetical protein
LAGLTQSPAQSGVLEVQIEELTELGVPLPSGQSTPTPHPFYLGTVRIAVVRPEAPKNVVDEQLTGIGHATFRLPPGRYWVFLPVGNQPFLDQRFNSVGRLPDETSVFAWTAVVVPTGGSIQATLTFVTPQP